MEEDKHWPWRERVCVWVHVWVGERERERERERARESVCVCVCACVGGRESVCVCVCVWMGKKKNGGEQKQEKGSRSKQSWSMSVTPFGPLHTVEYKSTSLSVPAMHGSMHLPRRSC